ncbi:uncharacterized protein LOC112126254 [Cimex lectularius]|uniref:MADF domain-containing protein n=1 Tax=Cimex lectularius TaxID=79782 RepID=A0A8I6SKL3_CIMLE|nr:uncharacterized protein LOC112126254 [Cimex lectularius]
MKFLANHETPTASVSTLDISDSSIDVVDHNEDLDDPTLSDADVHELLKNRKLKRNEGFYEYFWAMNELATRRNIDEGSLIRRSICLSKNSPKDQFSQFIILHFRQNFTVIQALKGLVLYSCKNKRKVVNFIRYFTSVEGRLRKRQSITVLSSLRNDFEDMEDKEKNAFGKEVTKRWGNLRDAFSKSKRKLKESKKSGAGARTFKNYVYAEQMQFLNKLFQTREVVDSLDGGTENNEDENVDALPGATVPPKENPKPRENKRRRQPDEVEMKIIKALEEPSLSPHILFFQGLLPHLNKFDDSEVLEFQMGVLEVISKIKNKQKTLLNLNSFHGEHLSTILAIIPFHSINHFPLHKCLIPINSASNHKSPKPISPTNSNIPRVTTTIQTNSRPALQKGRQLNIRKGKRLHNIWHTKNLAEHLQRPFHQRAPPQLDQIPLTTSHNFILVKKVI